MRQSCTAWALRGGDGPACDDPACAPAQMLERETSREKNLEKAQKEARIRARKEAQRAADGVPSAADDGPDMQQVPVLMPC